MTITLNVGPSGYTYTSIASAVAQIPTGTPLTEDYVILLHNGTYNEAVTVQNIQTSGSAHVKFTVLKGHEAIWTNAGIALTISSVPYVDVEKIYFNLSTSGNAFNAMSSNYCSIKKCKFAFKDDGCIKFITSHGFTIENNILIGQSKTWAGFTDGHAIDISLSGVPYTSKIQNNTIFTPSDMGGTEPHLIDLDMALNTGTVELRNNIISSSSLVSCNFVLVSGHVAGSFTVSNNCYFCAGTTNWNYNTVAHTNLASWIIATGDVNSIDDDPLFVNQPTNFILTENSPCIDTGFTTSTTEDYFGSTRPEALGYDMGALEGAEASIIMYSGSTRLNPVTRIAYFN